MRRPLTLLLVLALGPVGGAFAGAHSGTPVGQRVLTSALHALHARGVSVRVSETRSSAHGRQRVLIFSGVSSPEAQWKAEVAAGVFAAHGFAPTWINDGSGTITYYYDPMRRFGRRAARLAPATKPQIVAAITTATRGAGAHLDKIEMLHPLAFAPVVTITVRNPAQFDNRGGLQRKRALQSLLDFAKLRVEGVFLIVRDPHGHVGWRGGFAVRPSIGVGDWPNLLRG